MKWLFMLLLIVNLVILGWGFQRERSAASIAPVLPADLGDLRLLSEMELALTSEQPLPRKSTEVPPVSQPLPVVEEESGKARPGAVDEEVTILQPDPGPGATDDIAQKLTARKEVPSTEKPTAGAETESEESPDLAKAEKKSVTLICGAFGPLEHGSRARSILSSVLKNDIEASLRSETHKKTIGYWVLIPPLESKEAAIKTVKELKAQGVKDIRRFFKGEQENGISLGVFSKQGNAEKRQQELKEKGHSAEVQPRYIDAPLYWVDYRAEEVLSKDMFNRLLQKYPKLKREIYNCSSIVTSSGIF